MSKKAKDQPIVIQIPKEGHTDADICIYSNW